jgi:hypothetical protein
MDKKVDFPMGEYGSASIDANTNGKVTVSVALEIDIYAELQKLADKSGNPIAEEVVTWLKKIGVMIP